jgi:hypothetical protein
MEGVDPTQYGICNCDSSMTYICGYETEMLPSGRYKWKDNKTGETHVHDEVNTRRENWKCDGCGTVVVLITPLSCFCGWRQPAKPHNEIQRKIVYSRRGKPDDKKKKEDRKILNRAINKINAKRTRRMKAVMKALLKYQK